MSEIRRPREDNPDKGDLRNRRQLPNVSLRNHDSGDGGSGVPREIIGKEVGSAENPERHDPLAGLGGFSDDTHPFEGITLGGEAITYYGKTFAVENITDQLEEARDRFVGTNQRVAAKAAEICPDVTKVFAPFNGSETIGLGSDYTLATDRLAIGTPAQVQKLYNNPSAKALYLIDKLDRGHSYSGVTQELGYMGASLLWDIEEIQKGIVEEVQYLDDEGNALEDRDSSPAGIKITYDANGKQRIHEQYSCDFASLPFHVKEQLDQRKFDGLYLRGTHSLVTQVEHFPEYRAYVHGLRSGGVITADASMQDLTWQMEGEFAENMQVALADDEQFGYAGKHAKIAATVAKDLAFFGHVNVLKKA